MYLLSTLGKRRGPSIEQTSIPFTQECIVPDLVEIGPVALEKIFKFRQCILAISLLSYLIGKGRDPSFEQT